MFESRENKMNQSDKVPRVYELINSAIDISLPYGFTKMITLSDHDAIIKSLSQAEGFEIHKAFHIIDNASKPNNTVAPDYFEWAKNELKSALTKANAEILVLREEVEYYENVIKNKIDAQKKWLCEVFKSSEETFRLFDRADLIGNAEASDRSQEAAHYNWLDDQNDKLEKENAELKELNRKLAEQLAKANKFFNLLRISVRADDISDEEHAEVENYWLSIHDQTELTQQSQKGQGDGN